MWLGSEAIDEPKLQQQTTTRPKGDGRSRCKSLLQVVRCIEDNTEANVETCGGHLSTVARPID